MGGKKEKYIGAPTTTKRQRGMAKKKQIGQVHTVHQPGTHTCISGLTAVCSHFKPLSPWPAS